MAANSRPSVICCVTSAKSQDKHLKPLALTVAQSLRGQQQGMDTCFIRSARPRDKDRRAATEYKCEGGKEEKNDMKEQRHSSACIGNRDTRDRRKQLGQLFSLPSLHFDFLGDYDITLLYEMGCFIFASLPEFAQ